MLLVDIGGRRWAIALGTVAEVRGIDALATRPGAAGMPFVCRNGIRIPVHDLRDLVGVREKTDRTDPAAVLVFDLPDRIAAAIADAACEVRIAHRRAPEPADRAGVMAVDSVAQWDGGEAPVLNITLWLDALDRDAPGES